MKIAVFSCRPDERPLFEYYGKKYQIVFGTIWNP